MKNIWKNQSAFGPSRGEDPIGFIPTGDEALRVVARLLSKAPAGPRDRAAQRRKAGALAAPQTKRAPDGRGGPPGAPIAAAIECAYAMTISALASG